MARQRILTLCFLGGSILALLLLAFGLTGLTFQPGRFYNVPNVASESGVFAGDSPIGGAGDLLPAIFSLMGMLALLFLVVSLIMSIFSAKYRRYLLRQIIGVGVILLLLSLIRPLAGEDTARNGEVTSGQPQSQLPAGEPLPQFTAAPASWLTWALVLLLALLLVGGIWFFWRRGRPQLAPAAASPPLAEAAQQALADISIGGDVRDAVLRCYREMNRVLAEQRGVQRARAMTPREFADHLRVTGLQDEHIERLTQLFERARYGGRHASERDAQDAVACLSAIVAAYGEPA